MLPHKKVSDFSSFLIFFFFLQGLDLLGGGWHGMGSSPVPNMLLEKRMSVFLLLIGNEREIHFSDQELMTAFSTTLLLFFCKIDLCSASFLQLKPIIYTLI